jgi:hypothetical protein
MCGALSPHPIQPHGVVRYLIQPLHLCFQSSVNTKARLLPFHGLDSGNACLPFSSKQFLFLYLKPYMLLFYECETWSFTKRTKADGV